MLEWKDFETIVINEIPLIDVRAPIEFSKGAFKNAVNLPLMDDEERHRVGICYAEKGSQEAVRLGHSLVSGEIKQDRINAWINHLQKYPNSIIYCFRGGMRSEITQRWIAQATGKEIPRLAGGYKAFRNYLIEQLQPSRLKGKPVLVGGFTGSGKTLLLKKLDNAIDLEGIANHRGSAFGKHLTPQPTQINFENNLAYALIQHRHKGYSHIIFEDEGPNIGRCFIPKPLTEYFYIGDFVIVITPLEERIVLILEEYVYQAQRIYADLYNEGQGLAQWVQNIRDSLGRIKKRLGGYRYKLIMELFEQAYRKQMDMGSFDGHKSWIEMLLKEYYDPMYRHQMETIADKIVFEGNRDEVLGYLKDKYY